MKRKLSMLIVALIIVTTCTITNIAADYNVNVESVLAIDGEGTIDRDLLAQTEYGYTGQRLRETMYSHWISTNGLSNISYMSNLNVYIGKSETQENVNTTKIKYEQTAFNTNMKQKILSQNYNAGIVTGFKTVGRSGKAFEIEMLPDQSYFELEGGIEGKTTLDHMVIDPNTRLKIVKERTRLEGTYNINWLVHGVELVTSGKGHDWLGCP